MLIAVGNEHLKNIYSQEPCRVKAWSDPDCYVISRAEKGWKKFSQGGPIKKKNLTGWGSHLCQVCHLPASCSQGGPGWLWLSPINPQDLHHMIIITIIIISGYYREAPVVVLRGPQPHQQQAQHQQQVSLSSVDLGLELRLTKVKEFNQGNGIKAKRPRPRRGILWHFYFFDLNCPCWLS